MHLACALSFSFSLPSLLRAFSPASGSCSSSQRRSFVPKCHHADARSHAASASASSTRRNIIFMMPLLAIATTSFYAALAEEPTVEYQTYTDELDKFSLLVPSDWVKGEGKTTGQRKVTAFFPPNDTSTNVNIIITALGPDYTSLGSFGTADAFAENLVNSLDRSWQKPPGQAARLITSKSNNGLYFIDYTLQKPGERKKIFISAVGIGFNGWYNRLFTVTGQYLEEEQEKYRSLLEKVVSSFTIIPRMSDGGKDGSQMTRI